MGCTKSWVDPGEIVTASQGRATIGWVVTGFDQKKWKDGQEEII